MVQEDLRGQASLVRTPVVTSSGVLLCPGAEARVSGLPREGVEALGEYGPSASPSALRIPGGNHNVSFFNQETEAQEMKGPAWS